MGLSLPDLPPVSPHGAHSCRFLSCDLGIEVERKLQNAPGNLDAVVELLIKASALRVA
jgi:hypothetical protein